MVWNLKELVRAVTVGALNPPSRPNVCTHACVGLLVCLSGLLAKFLCNPRAGIGFLHRPSGIWCRVALDKDIRSGGDLT